MNQIDQIQPTTTASSQAKSTGQMLGKDDFLKLLVGQLQHQDPMQPSGDKEFISQMTQFSMLEQLTNLTAGLQLGQATALIGRTITWTDSGGTVRQGAVTQVSVQGGKPTLSVGDEAGIDPAAVSVIA